MKWFPLLLLCACTAARLHQAHANAAAALQCPKERTLLFQDENGYQALGCGAIARCLTAESCERMQAASCRSVAEFDDQLCQALAAQPRQGIFMEQWYQRTRDENVCEEKYRAEMSMCPSDRLGLATSPPQSLSATAPPHSPSASPATARSADN